MRLIVDTSAVDTRTPFELLLVPCPDPLVQPHLDHLVRRTALPIPADRGVGRMLAGLFGLLVEGVQGGTLGGAEQDVADSVLGLVRALHRDTGDDRRPAGRRSSAALRTAIKARALPVAPTAVARPRTLGHAGPPGARGCDVFERPKEGT